MLCGVQTPPVSLGAGDEGSGKISENLALRCRGIAAFPEGVFLHVMWGVHEAGQHGLGTLDLAPLWAFVWGISNG